MMRPATLFFTKTIYGRLIALIRPVFARDVYNWTTQIKLWMESIEQRFSRLLWIEIEYKKISRYSNDPRCF